MFKQCALCCPLYVAPAIKGSVQLNYTIPDLLDMGCAYGYQPALHQWSPQGWQSLPYGAFRLAVEELALGLATEGIQGRIGLMLDSGVDWALADMGSLLAGLVTVPIDSGQPVDDIQWIVADAQLSALVVSNWDTLEQFSQVLEPIGLILVGEDTAPSAEILSKFENRLIKTLTEIRHQGRLQHSPETIRALKEVIHASDLATIVYTADASGLTKGAMLSHQNLTGNILAAFSSMPGLAPGTPERALSFLPLNHIFARAFLYGHFGFGHHIYFSSPKRVFRHLATVKPTIFITVPRLLEKVYERINSLRQQSSGLKKRWLNWGWHQAHIGNDHLGWRRLQQWLVSYGVFGSLRRSMGGHIRYLLCGGAALRPEIMAFFNGVGIPVKQGYGLTETSSVLTYTRDRWLRPGTVGAPIPGVELRLAEDGEVLAKSPYTMEGYYHNPVATKAVIDADGWFHTGDLGEFSDDGVLTLHGCKKGLFKLSTGKYVAPGPIEQRLMRSLLVKRALLVGPGQKFCGVLIVPDTALLQALRPGIGESEVSFGDGGREQSVVVRSHYQPLIDQLNPHLPHWSTIKRFALVQNKAAAELSREQLYQAYAQEIEALYSEAEPIHQKPSRQLSGWFRSWRRLRPFFHRNRRANVA